MSSSTSLLEASKQQFHRELTNHLNNLLENDDRHNVVIEAGEEPNVNKFKAHYYILTMRSPYFRNALSSRWARKENGMYIFKKPNISPLTFDIVLRYDDIYYSVMLFIAFTITFIDLNEVTK